MSPWRTLQWRKPARSSRARASASMSSDMSRPRPRSIEGPNSSSIRPVPVPRSSSERNGCAGQRRADRLLHRLVGDMQLADAVPLGGVPAEISLRRRGARLAHRGEPFAVAHERRLGGIEPADQSRANAGAAALLGQPEERPGALAEALDQPGFGQQPQMARDARLRLAQDVGEVGDRQFGLGQKRQNAQARRLAGCLERAVEVLEREVGRTSHGWAAFLKATRPGAGHKDIFIRLTGTRKR